MNSRKKPAFRRSLTLGSFVALYLGMFVCYLLPWNGGILYGILITIRDNVVFFMGLFLVCGYVVIFLIYWGKTLGYLGDVVRATEQIYKGGDGPVILPAALHDIETHQHPGMPQVAKIIDRHAADIEPHHPGFDGDEGLFAA